MRTPSEPRNADDLDALDDGALDAFEESFADHQARQTQALERIADAVERLEARLGAVDLEALGRSPVGRLLGLGR